jgi:hypothetical protein
MKFVPMITDMDTGEVTTFEAEKPKRKKITVTLEFETIEAANLYWNGNSFKRIKGCKSATISKVKR